MRVSDVSEMCAVYPLTGGGRNHFFGYYDKPQFDPSGRYALGLACDVFDRLQKPSDKAELGLVDTAEGNRWISIGITRAWNWQFGCLAQWMPSDGKAIVYNDRREGGFVSVLLDVFSRRERVIPSPVFDVHPGGKKSLTVNFCRLSRVRPETGLPLSAENSEGTFAPSPPEDGLFELDLLSGKRSLLVSLRRLAENKPEPSMRGALHYVTHPLWNADGSRFLFWHRWRRMEERHGSRNSRLYTSAPDGSNLLFLMEGNSHSAWRGKDSVLAWADKKDGSSHYFLCREGSGQCCPVGKEALKVNGHFTFSPDGRWLLTDTTLDENRERAVLLYNCETGWCCEVGRFLQDPALDAPPVRCDLHPRFHPGGSLVCVDSSHEGSRQIYMIDVSRVTKGKGLCRDEKSGGRALL